MMNKSLEWIKNLKYRSIVKIYLLIIFGWNFFLLLLAIYSLGKGTLVIFGIFLMVIILVLLLKRKWNLLLGLGSIVLSTIISCILIMYYIDLLLVWVMMTWLIAGIFLILCGVKNLNIPIDKRKIMISRGVIGIIFAIIGISTCFY